MTSAPLISRPVRWTGKTASQIRSVYKRVFPRSEQVPVPLLHLNSLRPCCSFLAWFDAEDDSHIAGFTYSYETADLVYLGFLAVDDSRHSRGYGSRILDAFATRYADRPQVLEIEPVEDGFNNYQQRVRRLAFYRRNGFELTGLETLEGKERYTVLVRNGPITQKKLQRALNRLGLWVFRSKVIRTESVPEA